MYQRASMLAMLGENLTSEEALEIERLIEYVHVLCTLRCNFHIFMYAGKPLSLSSG